MITVGMLCKNVIETEVRDLSLRNKNITVSVLDRYEDRKKGISHGGGL